MHPALFRLPLLLAVLAILLPGAPRAQAPGAAEPEETPGGDNLISLPFISEVPIQVIVTEIKDQSGVDVLLKGKAGAVKTPVVGDNMTVEEALNKIAGPANLVWRKTAEGYELWDQQTWETEVVPTLVEQKVFRPQHVTSAEFFDAVKNSNIVSKYGSVAEDARTNQVIVRDLPENLAMLQDLLNLLDTEQVTRIFEIKYADVNDVAEKIAEFKSEPGVIDVDPLNSLIIARDTMTNIRKMESLIEILDIRQVRKVYNLNSVGISGDGADAIKSNLDLIVTPDAYYYIDDQRGLLILEDRPEVHEEVEEFLRIFDRPIEQVLIQGELLDVKDNFSLNYGLETTISGDLKSAVADGLASNFASGAAVPDEGVDMDNLYGFLNYRDEFPIATINQGLNVRYLGRHVKAQLQAALSDSNTRVLLKPRLIVKNGEEGTIESQTRLPYANIQYNSNYSDRSSVSVSYADSGLIIKVTPSIAPTGLIEMELNFSNKSADQVTLTTGDQNFQTMTAYRVNNDEASTVLIIPDGETRVIGGIITRDETENRAGVPFLVDIPWIGPLLFGNKENTKGMRNLLFFVTPTVVRERASRELVAYEFDRESAEAAEWLDADLLSEYRFMNEPTSDVEPGMLPPPVSEPMLPVVPFEEPEPIEGGERYDAPEPGGDDLGAVRTLDPASIKNDPESLKRLLVEGMGETPESLREEEAPESSFRAPAGSAAAPTEGGEQPQPVAKPAPGSPGGPPVPQGGLVPPSAPN